MPRVMSTMPTSGGPPPEFLLLFLNNALYLGAVALLLLQLLRPSRP